MNLCEKVRAARDIDTFHIFDDFWIAQNDSLWIDTLTDSGTVAILDQENGVMALTCSDGTVADNDQVILESAGEFFLVEANRSLYFAAYIQFTEANTDDANIAVGFANAPAAELLIDDGAGLKTSGNWFSIYKVDGETVWRANCRNSTATGAGSALGDKSLTTAGGASFQLLEIFIEPIDSTNVRVTYKVDGQYLRKDGANSADDVIKHTLAIASSTEMAVFFTAKNGGANNEVLNVDYVLAAQTR